MSGTIEQHGRWTETEARDALEALRTSGKSLAAFARERGVSPQRFYWWRRRLGEVEAAPDFLPAIVSAPAVTLSAAPVMTVRAPGGLVLEISDPEAVPAQWLAALLRELEAAER